MQSQQRGLRLRRIRPCSDAAWLTVNLVTGSIRDGQGALHQLRPKALALFDLLTSHPGELVSKKQLFEQLWPGELVGEATVRNAIAELRRELVDDDRDHPMMVTVPRQGYKFAGECKEQGMHASPGLRTRLRMPLGLVAGVVIGVLLNEAVQVPMVAAISTEYLPPPPQPDCMVRIGERFDGAHGREIDVASSPDLGRGDFTIALWLRTTGRDGVILDQRHMSPKVVGYALVMYQGKRTTAAPKHFEGKSVISRTIVKH